MTEARPFRPENTEPDEFMRPATETFRDDVSLLSHAAEDKINGLIAERHCHITGKSDSDGDTTPKLRIGSEVELLLFSPDSDPDADAEKSRKSNPNYRRSHLRKVREFAATLVKPPEEGGLLGIVHSEVEKHRIFLEPRITPGTVGEFEDKIDTFQRWVQDMGHKLDVHPAVLSQHYHFSFTDAEGRSNLMEDPDTRHGVHEGVTDMYHRALPIIRIPEHLEGWQEYQIGIDCGIRYKGERKTPSDPYRLEGRLNNSEYAFDPNLNLLVNLKGIERGMEHIGKPEQLETGYPMDHVLVRILDEPDYRNRAYFITGNKGKGMKYEPALERLPQDEVLGEAMPVPLLHGLTEAAGFNRDIAAGKFTVAQVREKMNHK